VAAPNDEVSRVDHDFALKAFDQQIRQRRRVGDEPVARVLAEAGWAGVTWSALTEDNADAAIAGEIERFAAVPGDWEWKYYSYDTPADLPRRLTDAGFVPDPTETLLVADIADLDLEVRVPDGIELVPITDAAGADGLVRVHDEVFGGSHARIGEAIVERLETEPDVIPAVLAMAGDRVVCGGRVEYETGTDFASIWGGGTLPEWRGKGIFRALVAYRAKLAAEAGYRYLQVDATEDSRPILQRLGFTVLATTTPYMHPGAA